ncbi:MAG: MTH938/NDUFAF3 family protein [Pseudomonadota bacterium]
MADPRARFTQFLPERAPIDAYGDGGFRFAEMSHRGSLLCLPSGIYGWPVESVAALGVSGLDAEVSGAEPSGAEVSGVAVSEADAAALEALFAPVVADRDALGFLLLGTGARQVFPSPALRALFNNLNLGLDTMDTGAAARTYNILLGEGRPVGAALIAVP